MGFRVQRTDEQVLFSSWREYLNARGDGGARRFCQVLETLYEPMIAPGLNPLEDDYKDLGRQINECVIGDSKRADLLNDQQELRELMRLHRLRGGFPWVTPVLGSGCLDAKDSATDRAIESVPWRLGHSYDVDELLPDGTSVQRLVENFSASLLRERVPTANLRSCAVDDDENNASPTDVKVAAAATLTAALLNRLYHQIVALSDMPLSRSDVKAVVPQDAQRSSELVAELVEPAQESLRDLKSRLFTDEEQNFVGRYVDLVLADLGGNPPSIRLSDVRLLAEISWHYMIRGTSEYAGWSDLLFLLSLKSGKSERHIPRPYITDPRVAQQWLLEGLEDTTERSWQSRVASENVEPTDRDAFYDVIAELVALQSQLKLKPAKPGVARDALKNRAPVASAFITSFDIELEMALGRITPRFLMVMPFQLRVGRGQEQRATFLWLGGLVDPKVSGHPAESLKNITSLRPEQWHLLDRDALSSPQLSNIPVVVRLTGSPLVEAPSLERGEFDNLRQSLLYEYKIADASHIELAHGILLDEHTAMHHAASELHSVGKSGSTPLPLGLPNGVATVKNPDLDARFWLALGVQLNHDGVRHRFASQFGTSAFNEELVDPQPQPRRAGVMVNRRSNASERDLLHWLGFDFVTSSYTDVLDDLRHYVQHLREPEARPTKDRCELGAGG